MIRSTTTYETYADSSAENYQRYFVPTIGTRAAEPVIEAAALEQGERVLDLACGTGVVSRLAAARVGPTGTMVGVDPTPAMLEVARRLPPVGPEAEWYQAAAEDLPLADKSFDAVVCSMGFQFFSDKASALREVLRVLVPGGRVALCTPGPVPPLFQAIDDVLTDHMGPEASAFVNAVFSVHDPDQVRDQVRAAGFGGVEVETRPLRLRVPAPADFLWQYVYSTPLAAIASQLSEQARAALEAEAVNRLTPFLDGDALVMAPGLLVATAYRS